jgi:L-alanine-DL-glutamate epimerase-like enolase superfamily enzyme
LRAEIGTEVAADLVGGLDEDGDLVEEPIHHENGYVSPPTGAGLGVTLDEQMIDRYARASSP